MKINPSALLLRQQPVKIRYGDRSTTVDTKVYFDLALNNSLFVEPSGSLSEICTSFRPEDSFFVYFDGSSGETEWFATSWNHRIGDDSGLFVRLSPRRSNLTLRSGSLLKRVNAGVVNFPNYFISGNPEGLKFELQHGNWIFEFVPVDPRLFLYPEHIQTQEYAFTHHLSFGKADKCLFPAEDAEDQLDLLSDFLSFCRGFWVSTALTTGTAMDGTTAMEELGTRKVSPTKVSYNWLDFHHGSCMTELFPMFISRISNHSWREAIRNALYWYVRADTALVGPDGGCILLQSALERLAWHVLVRDKQSLSAEGFTKLSAADQLRLLLSTLNIPLEIPNGLKGLEQICSGQNGADGPQVFVQVRNRLVHPPKGNRKAIELPTYEAFILGKWYVELTILSACGYTGQYSNRTKLRRWVGEVEPVPWALAQQADRSTQT